MPFKSKAQIRKFYVLKREGKLTQKDIDEWMSETENPSKLPERLTKKAFWAGFLKQADAAVGDGGNGFTGMGKGNLVDSDEEVKAVSSAETPRTDHTLLDRERNPRDFSPFELGPALEDENGSKIIY